MLRSARTATRRASLAALCGACVFLAHSPVRAQIDELDLEPPLIEHEVLAEAEAAPRQSFVAQVVDDRELASVRLYWRLSGQGAFDRLPMTRVSGSSTWLARVPTDPEEARDIEYWIEARDAGGNRTVRGFAFNPLVRRIVSAPLAARAPGRPRDARRDSGNGTPSGTPAEPESDRRALWVVLGAVGVAVLVGLAASGGDGGGGGEENPPTTGGCGPEGCRVVLTFDPPVAP